MLADKMVRLIDDDSEEIKKVKLSRNEEERVTINKEKENKKKE